MKRVFGLETEYGITVSGADMVDVVAESIELVRRYTEHGALMKWDYELEDPHLDARGFRARELLQDTDESAYYEIDKYRPFLQRPRSPGIFHARMHDPPANRGTGQGRGTHSRGMRATPKSEITVRPGSLAL